MKKLLFLSAMFSFSVFAQGSGVGTPQGEAYSPNDGTNPPGTFTTPNRAEPIPKKDKKSADATTSKTGVTNSSGVKPDEVNSAANPAPKNEQDATDVKTIKSERAFKTGPYNHDGDYAPKTDEQIQAEEERDAHLKEMEVEKRDTEEQIEAEQ